MRTKLFINNNQKYQGVLPTYWCTAPSIRNFNRQRWMVSFMLSLLCAQGNCFDNDQVGGRVEQKSWSGYVGGLTNPCPLQESHLNSIVVIPLAAYITVLSKLHVHKLDQCWIVVYTGICFERLCVCLGAPSSSPGTATEEERNRTIFNWRSSEKKAATKYSSWSKWKCSNLHSYEHF
jgi:hypothetical protein